MSWFDSLIGKLKIGLNFSRNNSPNVRATTELNIAQANYNGGLTQDGAIALVDILVNQRLAEFTNAAERTYLERARELRKMLGELFLQLKESELNRLNDPDVQLAISDATRVIGRKSQDEYQRMLGLFVINKMKIKDENRDDLKNIVYNEAINTLAKLTTNQIKIIALSYIAGHVTFSGVDSWDSFTDYFKLIVLPLLDYIDNQTDFAHIEYAGCGSLTMVGRLNYMELFRHSYSFLFVKRIDAEVIDELKLPDSFISDAMTYEVDTKTYQINKVRNVSDLQVLLEKHLTPIELRERVVSLYNSNLCNNSEMQTEVSKRLPELEPYLSAIQNTSLSKLTLTSVGLMVAISYIEQSTGVKLDISKWIN